MHAPISTRQGCDLRGNAASARPAPGFTLIEILVVVAIIALLISILLPSLARSRAMGRSSVCNHNVHQMGTAMHVFVAENKDRVPRGLSRHGGGGDPTGPVNWVRMVARLFGDKNSYARNFNRVPVEKYDAFSCPERSQQDGAKFLDYVVNSTDSRGPLTASCKVDPINGVWYEVEGVSKMDRWKFPGETIYITEAIEESWAVADPNNSYSTMQGIREHINELRLQEPPSDTGFDWFDVAGGRSFPTYRQFLDETRKPRASLKMHLNRGSNAVFVDGHVSLTNPPPEREGMWKVHEYYMRMFGVDRKIIPGSTAVATTANNTWSCSIGDTNWRP